MPVHAFRLLKKLGKRLLGEFAWLSVMSVVISEIARLTIRVSHSARDMIFLCIIRRSIKSFLRQQLHG